MLVRCHIYSYQLRKLYCVSLYMHHQTSQLSQKTDSQCLIHTHQLHFPTQPKQFSYVSQLNQQILFTIKIIYPTSHTSNISVEGRIFYKNGSPLQILPQYHQQFQHYLNRSSNDLKIYVSKQDSSNFKIKINPNPSSSEQISMSPDPQQLIKYKIQKFRYILQDALICLGLIKKYNRKAKLIKSQELQLKKDIAQIIKKKAQALPNKQNAMEEEGNSVKYVFKITEKKKQIDNEDCKPKKGGYFIVKNSLFEIQETLHHESKPYLQELAYKEIKNLHKKTQILNLKLEKQLKIVQKVNNSKHFLKYWKSSESSQIFMEYVPHTLKAQLRSHSHSMNQMINISCQIVKSVQELHKVSVVHRDIKPQNFLVKKQKHGNVVKIIDFGESVFLDEPLQKSIQPLGYTLPYSPLECIRGDENGTKKKEIDYWSIGMLIYEMVYKRTPFTYGQCIGGNIVESWLSDKNSQFEMYVNKRRRRGIRVVEELVTVLALNCLQMKQQKRMNLEKISEIVTKFDEFSARVRLEMNWCNEIV